MHAIERGAHVSCVKKYEKVEFNFDKGFLVW